MIPELSGGVGIAFMHRVAALLLLIVVAVMGHYAYWRNRDNREIQMLGISATVLCLLQVFSGALIMATMHNEEVYVFSALGHTLLISALFGVLCYLSVRVWQLSKPLEAEIRQAATCPVKRSYKEERRSFLKEHSRFYGIHACKVPGPEFEGFIV